MRYILSLRYLLVLSVLLCTACGTALPTVKPYKLDVQQGNVVTSKMLLQLRPGMTKSQVRFIMGTPLIQDSFHGNRWDYVYQLREKGKIVEQRRVILDFENELLKAVRGDVIPAGTGPKDEAAPNTGARVVPPKPKHEERSWTDKLKFWKKDEVPKASPVPEKAPVAPAPVTEPAPAAEQPATPAEQAPVQPAQDEQKSILAVPLEVAPAAAPAEAPASESAPAIETPAPQAEPIPAESAAPTAAPEAQAAPAPEPTPEPAPTPTPENAPYQSGSGMQFDRNLKLQPEAEAAPTEAKPASSANKPAEPRAGNTSVPPPKELPPESDPTFFEQMLERIGF